MNYYNYEIDFLNLYVLSEENYIIGIYFSKPNNIDDFAKKESELILETKKQIEEYLRGKRKKFEIPIKLYGTDFQKKVWNALLAIPYGETQSYKDIAIAIKNDKAYRAVGLANNKNPISIIVPCHRVIGSNGKLVGYGGGLDKKEKLLSLEKQL